MTDQPKDLSTELLNVHEAAAYLNVSRTLLLKLRKDRKLPFVMLSDKLLFRKSSLDKFISDAEKTN